MKIMAHMSGKQNEPVQGEESHQGLAGIKDNTLRIARLKLLLIAVKVVTAGNRDKVKYSIHDSRTPALIKFYKFLDQKRSAKKAWRNSNNPAECHC